MREPILIAAALLALTGCGHEIGRIRLMGEGSAGVPVTVEAAAQRLRFGIRIDASYTGRFAPMFTIELVDQAGTVVGRTTCEPHRDRTTRACSVYLHGRNHTEEHCGYGTRCALVAPSPGRYRVQAQLAFGQSAVDLQVEHVDLVVKR